MPTHRRELDALRRQAVARPEPPGRDVGMEAATKPYMDNVLRYRPDEQAVLGTPVDQLETAD